MTYNVFSGTLKPYSINQTHVNCGQTAGWIKMALGMQVVLGPGHIVLDVDPAALPKKGGRAHVLNRETTCPGNVCPGK